MCIRDSPYGVYIISNQHRSNISQLNEEERLALAETLKNTTGMLDSLFGYKFPYMMLSLIHISLAVRPGRREASIS